MPSSEQNRSTLDICIYWLLFLVVASSPPSYVSRETCSPDVPFQLLLLRGLRRRAVSVRLSVTFVYGVEMSRHILKLFIVW